MRHVKQESPSNDAVYTIRVGRATLDRITEIAAGEHRTLAGKLRVMMEEEIARYDDERAVA